jgi:hypothetical protein
MKTIKTTIVLVFALLLIGCNKDDDNSSEPTSENFLQSYLTQTGFTEQTIPTTITNKLECGIAFASPTGGKITHIRVKLPQADPALKITLWKADPSGINIIFSTTVNIPNANEEVIIPVLPITIESGTVDIGYVISMYTNSFYKRRRTAQTDATYPLNAGNIKILSFAKKPTQGPGYPEDPSNKFEYWGDLSFDFVKN